MEFSPSVSRPLTGFFSLQSRLSFEGVTEDASHKPGIRYHSFLVAFILRHFSRVKIVSIKDVDGNIYYLNRGSMVGFLKRQNQLTEDHDYVLVTKHYLRGQLDEFFKKTSSANIIQLSQKKNDLAEKEYWKKHGAQNGWDSAADRKLPEEIAALKASISSLEEQRRSASS